MVTDLFFIRDYISCFLSFGPQSSFLLYNIIMAFVMGSIFKNYLYLEETKFGNWISAFIFVCLNGIGLEIPNWKALTNNITV